MLPDGAYPAHLARLSAIRLKEIRSAGATVPNWMGSVDTRIRNAADPIAMPHHAPYVLARQRYAPLRR